MKDVGREGYEQLREAGMDFLAESSDAAIYGLVVRCHFLPNDRIAKLSIGEQSQLNITTLVDLLVLTCGASEPADAVPSVLDPVIYTLGLRGPTWRTKLYPNAMLQAYQVDIASVSKRLSKQELRMFLPSVSPRCRAVLFGDADPAPEECLWMAVSAPESADDVCMLVSETSSFAREYRSYVPQALARWRSLQSGPTSDGAQLAQPAATASPSAPAPASTAEGALVRRQSFGSGRTKRKLDLMRSSDDGDEESEGKAGAKKPRLLPSASEATLATERADDDEHAISAASFVPPTQTQAAPAVSEVSGDAGAGGASGAGALVACTTRAIDYSKATFVRKGSRLFVRAAPTVHLQ